MNTLMMKKLYIIFVAYLVLISAGLFIFQFEFDSTVASSIIFFISFIASLVLAFTFGGIVLAIYFEPFYLKIKWPLICLSIVAVAITTYPISLIGRIEFLKQLDVYAYIPQIVAFILGSIFYVQITNILKREKINYDATWIEILLGNEKVNALETDTIKNASSNLYYVSLGIVFAVTITDTDVIVIIAALIGIVVGYKYFKKAALYFKTKAYIITESIYYGSILLTAVMFYVTNHQSVVFYPIIGFIVFKIGYYKALKQKFIHEKTRAY